jgi:nucleoside 2-deoxyribosyltransferase
MPNSVVQPRVYLAGPGVFRPDAKSFGRLLREKCARVGLEGCFPLDNEVAGTSLQETATAIYRANVCLIDSVRAIIADISPFRGPNMDPGTAWEIGYGIARGLPVYAWTEHSDNLLLRVQTYLGVDSGSNISVDQNGWIIEDFGLTENLMIAISCASIHSNADEAISACAAALGKLQN